MKQKIQIILAALASMLIVLTISYHSSDAKYYPKRVLRLPHGFVNLQEAVDDTGGAVEYLFFESYLSLVDKGGNSVGGALVVDKSFVVTYQGEYYINAEQFRLAWEKAIEDG